MSHQRLESCPEDASESGAVSWPTPRFEAEEMTDLTEFLEILAGRSRET